MFFKLFKFNKLWIIINHFSNLIENSMCGKILKITERVGKEILDFCGIWLFHFRKKRILTIDQLRKILVLRLDQRIGNGIMLLPLLKAIRQRLPQIELHLLLHQPVSDIFEKFSAGIIDTFYPYQQEKLLTHPALFLSWLNTLRKQRYDLIISSHNPDNFSLSQAFLGWWCRPKMMIGFSWQKSVAYYDVAVPSSPDKHYADAQLDLWRYFDPATKLVWGGLHISNSHLKRLSQKYSMNISEPTVLLWLGATGNKVLPFRLISLLYEECIKHFGYKVVVAVGPNDEKILQNFPEEFQKEVLIWRYPLKDTLIFLATQRAFISGDTGPAHLAAVLGLPMLTIFINSKSEQYGYHDGERRFAIVYDGSSESEETIITAIKKIAESIIHEDKPQPNQ